MQALNYLVDLADQPKSSKIPNDRSVMMDVKIHRYMEGLRCIFDNYTWTPLDNPITDYPELHLPRRRRCKN